MTSEIESIVSVVESFLHGQPAELYLYGSRTNDQLKGGDIDLLLLVPKEIDLELNTKKHYLLSQLKIQIGERRIDLSITTQAKAKTGPFFQTVLKSADLLKHWK